MTLPQGRPGQVLAVALLVVAGFVLWLGAVSPVLFFYADRADEIGRVAARIARERALIASLSALRAAAAQASDQPAAALLTGNNDAVAGAALQEQVQGIASGQSATLTSIETMPAEQRGAFRRIGVHIQMTAQLEVVTGMMAAIERAAPAMVIDDVHLAGGADSGLPNTPPAPIDTSFSVYAFRRGTEPHSADTMKGGL
jgi:hypothetical protein